MAEFVDVQEEELQPEEQLEMFDDAEDSTTIGQPEPLDVEDEDDDDIPDKYRGKSPKDIIRMHQEAEKLLGRQSSEVGELRRVVDNFIMSQSQPKQPKQEAEDIDIFTDPDRYTEERINSHPKIKEFERMTVQMKRDNALGRLNATHPDWQGIVGSSDFQEWVKASKVRTELFARADRGYDFDSASELIGTWKERLNVVNKTKEVEDREIKRQRKAASTGSGKGGGESKSRKVYRRSDIIDLMQRDPDRYAQLSDEIMKAYQEGRVKN